MTGTKRRDGLRILDASRFDSLERRPQQLDEAREELGGAAILVRRGGTEAREELFEQARHLGERGKPVEGRAAPEPMRDGRKVVRGAGYRGPCPEVGAARRPPSPGP